MSLISLTCGANPLFLKYSFQEQPLNISPYIFHISVSKALSFFSETEEYMQC